MAEAIVNAYRQGLLIFAASGNDYQSEVGYPAFHPLAIAVGNSTITDTRNSSSNYGTALDLIAPGTGYYSTFRGGTTDNAGSGTSFAAPMAAAVGGLVLSENRDLGLNLTNDDIHQILRRSADDLGPAGFDVEYGYGRVNAEAALAMINAPNTVSHLTRSSGSSTMTWDSHAHTFINGAYGAGGFLASGSYYGVKQYRVTGYVSFARSYSQIPNVWARVRETTGWSGANPNYQSPFVSITNVTTTGFSWETFVYWIGSNANGQSINAYFPAAPTQLSVAFTAIGRPTPPPSASVSGPGTLTWKQRGTYTAYASGGTGATSYQWSTRSPGTTAWNPTGVTAQTYSFSMVFTGGIDLQARVARGSEVVYAERSVTYCAEVPCELERGAAPPEGMAEGSRSYETALAGAAPNPARGSATIRFSLAEASDVRVVVYDQLGREVARLVDGALGEGEHEALFDGASLPAGVYVVRMTAGSAFAASQRLTLVR